MTKHLLGSRQIHQALNFPKPKKETLLCLFYRKWLDLEGQLLWVVLFNQTIWSNIAKEWGDVEIVESKIL